MDYEWNEYVTSKKSIKKKKKKKRKDYLNNRMVYAAVVKKNAHNHCNIQAIEFRMKKTEQAEKLVYFTTLHLL